MKKLLILLFIIPLMAQSINDTDEAKEERRQEIKQKEQIRQEKMWKQREINRRKKIDKMLKESKMLEESNEEVKINKNTD